MVKRINKIYLDFYLKSLPFLFQISGLFKEFFNEPFTDKYNMYLDKHGVQHSPY